MSFFFSGNLLTTARSWHGCVALNGYLYVIGGNSGTTEVRVATLNGDGTIGSWSATSALPAARRGMGVAVVRRAADGKDYIVVCGGFDGTTTAFNTVYYTTQGASGALNAWSTSGATLTAARGALGCAVIGERIFVAGGTATEGSTAGNAVYSNTIDRIVAGTAWTDMTGSYLPAGRRNGQLAAYGRVLVWTGGAITDGTQQSTVYRGIFTDMSGTPAISWATTTSLPAALEDHSSLVYDRHVYVIGGDSGGRTSAIRRAPIYADGNVGEWYRTSTLNAALEKLAAVMDRGLMYAVGGNSGSDVASVNYENTPTFWKQVAISGSGIVRVAKVFYSGSLQYRYADKWFDDGTSPDPDVRLMEMSTIGRALGEDRLPSAAEIDLVLANDDGSADWLVDRATVSNVKSAIVRLFIGAYDVSAPTVIQWQALSEYAIGGTRRTQGTVSVGLIEALQGLQTDLVSPPTIREWRDSAAATNPIKNATGQDMRRELPDELLDSPIPLVFGREYAKGIKVFFGLSRQIINPQFSGLIFVFAATLNSGSSKQVNQLLVEHETAGIIDVPRETTGDRIVWEEYLGGTVSKDGRSWKIFFVGINPSVLHQHVLNRNPANVRHAPLYATEEHVAAIKNAWVLGTPLSGLGAINTESKASPESVLRDIVSTYTQKSAAYLDEDGLIRTEQTVHKDAFCAGTIAVGGLGLLDAFGEIASSWDVDIFADWTGRLSVTTIIRDYASKSTEVANLLELYEEELIAPSDALPADGQRWALANRVSCDGLKERPTLGAKGLEEPKPQSWTRSDTDLGTSRIVEQRISAAWRPAGDGYIDPFVLRQLDIGKARPIISFATSLRVVGALDLGSYFKLTWTRNALADPYTSAVFKVESMDVDTRAGRVAMTAAWVGDLATVQPYLFDDQSLIVRVQNDGTATVVDSDATVTFSSATLVSSGVAAGDHLILRDATESATAFKRNRAVRIDSVTDATHLELHASADLDFGAGAGVAVSAWEIRRSALTTPATSTPNYPDGSLMYGKVSNTSMPPTFSDASAGNQLV